MCEDINYKIHKAITDLHRLRDLFRQEEWYGSAIYANCAAESLFIMMYSGDKKQRPDHLISVTDLHYTEELSTQSND